VSKAKTTPCALTDTEAAGLKGDTSTDIRALPDYKKTISRLLQAGKFEQLDCLADSTRSNKEVFHGGTCGVHPKNAPSPGSEIFAALA